MNQLNMGELELVLRELTNSLSVEGDVVEFGCYKGDTSVKIAKFLKDWTLKQVQSDRKDWIPGQTRNDAAMRNISKDVKRLWLYDSFEGLPVKSTNDLSAMSQDFVEGELLVAKAEIVNRFKRSSLPLPRIKKAWFSDLTTADLPEKICFAFLDGDYYDSIRTSLLLIENKISKGGIIIVHDYQNPALPGVQKAVDEWLKQKPHKLSIEKTCAVIRY